MEPEKTSRARSRKYGGKIKLQRTFREAALKDNNNSLSLVFDHLLNPGSLAILRAPVDSSRDQYPSRKQRCSISISRARGTRYFRKASAACADACHLLRTSKTEENHSSLTSDTTSSEDPHPASEGPLPSLPSPQIGDFGKFSRAPSSPQHWNAPPLSPTTAN